MDNNQAIESARAVIGEQANDDYVIAPSGHAQQLLVTANPLAQVLQSTAVTRAANEYTDKNARAIGSRTIFVRTAGRANLAVLLTSLCAASLLALSVVDISQWVLLVVGIFAGIAGSFAIMWQTEERQGKLFARWMSDRAEAETWRLKYFEAITSAPNTSSVATNTPIELLELEYFRRYQLDVQKNYYRERQQDHERTADKTSRYASIAVLFGALATGLSGVLGLVEQNLIVLAAVGVLGAALAAYASTRETITQDRRNADRYSGTRDALLKLEDRLDDVRIAASNGDRESLIQFVAAIHEQLSVENRQWLEAGENISSAIQRIDRALAAGRSGSK